MLTRSYALASVAFVAMPERGCTSGAFGRHYDHRDIAESMLTNNAQSGFFAATPVAGSTANAALSRVTASHNGSSGFAANSFPVGSVTMTVVDSIAVENAGNGVVVQGADAAAIVSGSSLVRNSFADLAGAALLRTAQNNAVTGRGAADITGSLTANPLK